MLRQIPPRFVVGIFLLIIALVAFVLGRTQSNATSKSSALFVEPRYLDLGVVWSQSALKCDVPISNMTAETIEIVDFASSCACTSIEPPSIRIPAFASQTVAFTYDLTAVKVTNPEGTLFTTRIVPRLKSNTTAVAPVWRLSGRVRHAAELSPRHLALGRHVFGQSLPKSYSVNVHCHPIVTDLRAECDSELAVVHVQRSHKSAPRFVVNVSLADNLKVGRFDFPVYLRVLSDTANDLPTVAFRVSGFVMKQVGGIPTALLFGTVRRGESATSMVTLTSHNQQPFTVSHSFCNSAEITIGQATVDVHVPKPSHQFRVAIDAKELGIQAQTVEFTVDIEGLSTIVEIPVSYYTLPK